MESRPKRHVLSSQVAICRAFSLCLSERCWGQGGLDPPEAPPLGIWSTGYNSQDSKKEHIQTPTRLTLATPPEGTSKNLRNGGDSAPWIWSRIRSPCPKLILKGCGLIEAESNAHLSSVRLHGPPRTSPQAPQIRAPGCAFHTGWGWTSNYHNAYGKIMPWDHREDQRTQALAQGLGGAQFWKPLVPWG